MPDKFQATWVSHSSLAEFVRCPRAYYLKNVYKDPKTNHKVQVVTPALTLGSSVHEVLESLSVIPTKNRFDESLIAKFEKIWSKVADKKGGFYDIAKANEYFERGRLMLTSVAKNPGPLANLSVKISEELPQYWLSEDDNIILCGKVDWLEYLPDSDTVHIIDFKTGNKRQDENSLQLPIYYLLVRNTQKRGVDKASYWYLAGENENNLEEKELPDLEAAHNQVYALAKKVKLAKQLKVFKCPNGDDGCFACQPFEKILKGEAEYVGVGNYNQDLYVIPSLTSKEESVII